MTSKSGNTLSDSPTTPPNPSTADGPTLPQGISLSMVRTPDVPHSLKQVRLSLKERQFYRKSNEDIKDRKQNRGERKRYADRIFKLLCCLCVFMCLILLLVGADQLHLSDTVIISAIAAVVIQVIGLMALVMNYLFPKEPPRKIIRRRRRQKTGAVPIACPFAPDPNRPKE